MNALAARADAEMGLYVLRAELNWRGASWWRRLVVTFLPHKRLTFELHGYRFTVIERFEKPYLLIAREVAA